MFAQSLVRSLPLMACLLASAEGVLGQRSTTTSRAQRVVIHSPHFDEPDPERGHLNCAARPVRLFGFETASNSTDSASTMHVRVFRSLTPEPGVIQHVSLNGVIVQLTHLIDNGSERRLPVTLRFGGTTSADGGLHLSAPPGVYRIRVMNIGYRSGEGVIQFRHFARDSLHVFMDEAAICVP
jgi:hypothetical protein